MRWRVPRFMNIDGFEFNVLPTIPIAKSTLGTYDILSQDFIKDPLYWEKHIPEKYHNKLLNKKQYKLTSDIAGYINDEISTFASKRLFDELNNLTQEELNLIMYGIHPNIWNCETVGGD